VLKPHAAPTPAAVPTPKPAIPRPAAAPAPRTAVRPAGAKPADAASKPDAAEADPAVVEESTKESAIGAIIDVLALAASVAGLVLFYLDYTKAAILF